MLKRRVKVKRVAWKWPVRGLGRVGFPRLTAAEKRRRREVQGDLFGYVPLDVDEQGRRAVR